MAAICCQDDCSETLSVKWQVVNTGTEALAAEQPRGDFYESDEPEKGVRWETTAYRGTHWVEAFVIKDGVCVARSGKFLVKNKIRDVVQLNEQIVEDAALSWFKGLQYAVAHAPHLAPGEIATERGSFADVLLVGRLRGAIARLNYAIPGDAREEALRKVLRHDAPSLVGNNRAFHRMLRDGVSVEYRRDDGSIAGDHVRLIDFENPDANDWLAGEPVHCHRKPEQSPA